MDEDGDDLDDGEHDTADSEPTLGWPEDYSAKDTKSGPGFDEMEDDGQDLEDDELGDERDSGIGDVDGYHEQCGFAVAGALPWSVGGYVA